MKYGVRKISDGIRCRVVEFYITNPGDPDSMPTIQDIEDAIRDEFPGYDKDNILIYPEVGTVLRVVITTKDRCVKLSRP